MAAAATSVPALHAWQEKARPGKLKITGLELVRVEGERESLSGVDRQHQVQPLHVYEEHRPKEYSDSPDPKKGMSRVAALYLRFKRG